MTGFASLTHEDERATLGVTVRSVNHRFLDLQLRVPQSLAELEPRVRALLQKRLARGRVELAISVQLRHPAAPSVEVAGRKVLVVDDDIRNVFALTSALEQHGMRVMHAESGKEGIEMLKRAPDVDVVLMDIMMPGLDGLDTMRIIRQLEGHRDLPIIAVTAKAMMGDRDKCLEAGANDYIAKPVNVDELIATLARTVPAAA